MTNVSNNGSIRSNSIGPNNEPVQDGNSVTSCEGLGERNVSQGVHVDIAALQAKNEELQAKNAEIQTKYESLQAQIDNTCCKRFTDKFSGCCEFLKENMPSKKQLCVGVGVGLVSAAIGSVVTYEVVKSAVTTVAPAAVANITGREAPFSTSTSSPIGAPVASTPSPTEAPTPIPIPIPPWNP